MTNWRLKLTQILYPEVFETVDGLMKDVQELEEYAISLREQIGSLSAQLEELQNKQPSKLVKDDPKGTFVVGVDEIILEDATESNKPSSGSYLTYARARQLATGVAALYGGATTRVLNTNSMEPHIDANSILVLENVQPEDITVGDIISYDGNYSIHKHFHGSRILHRVINIRPDGSMLLKGDNNFKHDGWIPPEAVIGRLYCQTNYQKSNPLD